MAGPVTWDDISFYCFDQGKPKPRTNTDVRNTVKEKSFDVGEDRMYPPPPKKKTAGRNDLTDSHSPETRSTSEKEETHPCLRKKGEKNPPLMHLFKNKVTLHPSIML